MFGSVAEGGPTLCLSKEYTSKWRYLTPICDEDPKTGDRRLIRLALFARIQSE